VWVWGQSRLLAVLIAVGLVCGAAATHFDVASASSNIERLGIWGDTVSGMKLAGHGLGAFYTDFAGHAPNVDLLRSRPFHAHNDFLEIAYEIGPGIVLFLGLIAFALGGSSIIERAILSAFIMEAAVDMPLRYPATLFLASIVLGRLCADRRLLRHHIACWRMAVRGRLARNINRDGRQRIEGGSNSVPA
jgi:O-antigen ligase